MKRQTTPVTLAVAAVAILIGAMTGISAQQPAAGNNGKPTKPSKSAVQEITSRSIRPICHPDRTWNPSKVTACFAIRHVTSLGSRTFLALCGRKRSRKWLTSTVLPSHRLSSRKSLTIWLRSEAPPRASKCAGCAGLPSQRAG